MRLLALFLTIFCSIAASAQGRGGVASQGRPAYEAGAQAIRDGSSSLDAALSTACALAETHPVAWNTANSGFLLARGKSREAGLRGFCGAAPSSAHPEMFLANGEHDSLKRHWGRGDESGEGIVVPAPLKIGDKVAIAAPARNAATLPDGLFEMVTQFLAGKGFEVALADDVFVETLYGVGDGSEQSRANAFNALVRDPDIKAIFCLRGGYGSMHLLPHLDYGALRQNRPIIVGYSDITAMQVAILQNAGLVTFHGPMLSSNYGQGEAFDLLFAMLMNPADEYPLINLDGTKFSVINEGTAEGVIVGGNMTLLSSLMGTPYEIGLKNKILFIEELDEAPYKLHRYIWQLKLAGKLDEVSAIVIGDILPDKEYGDPEISLKVILEALKDLTVPVLYNVRAGHGNNPLTVPMGARVRIEGDSITVIQKTVERVEEINGRNIAHAGGK